MFFFYQYVPFQGLVKSKDLYSSSVFYCHSKQIILTLHSVLIQTHEETDNSPLSVNYRPVGSTMQFITKLSPPNFAVLQGHGTWSPRSSACSDICLPFFLFLFFLFLFLASQKYFCSFQNGAFEAQLASMATVVWGVACQR
jgi:hypothetical protein